MKKRSLSGRVVLFIRVTHVVDIAEFPAHITDQLPEQREEKCHVEFLF